MARQFAGTGGGNQGIAFSTAASIHNLSAFAVVFWFFSPDNSGGSDYAALYGDGGSFPISLDIQMKQSGAIVFFYRDSDSNLINLLSSSSGFDDSAWHWFAALKRGSTDFEFYVDGVSQGSSSTGVNSGGTITKVWVGNPVGTNVLPDGGRVAHLVTVPSSITIDEARSLAYGQICRSTRLFVPLGWGSPEPDYSGNGYSGTVTGTSKADHAPVGPPFSFKPSTVVVPAPILLDAAVTATATVTAALTTGIAMAAGVACGAVVTAALTTSIILGSVVSASASAASDFTTQINLTAAITSTAIAATTLTTETSFDAAVTVAAAQASSLTTQIEIVCGVSAQAAAAGELTVGLNLDAAVVGSANVTGEIATQIPLTAAGTASAFSTPQLTTAISLAANGNGEASAISELTTDITLSADATLVASLSGILNAQKIFNVVQLPADFKTVAAKSALFSVTRSNKVLFTRNRTKEVLF